MKLKYLIKYLIFSAALATLPLKGSAEEWRTPQITLKTEYRDSIASRLMDEDLELIPDIYQSILNKHGFQMVYVKSFENQPEFAEIRGKTEKDIPKDSEWYNIFVGHESKTLDQFLNGVQWENLAFVGNLTRHNKLHEAGHAIDGILAIEDSTRIRAQYLAQRIVKSMSSEKDGQENKDREPPSMLSETDKFRKVYQGKNEQKRIDKAKHAYRKRGNPKDSAFEEWFAEAFAMFYDDPVKTGLSEKYPSTYHYFLKLEERFGIKREVQVASEALTHDKTVQLASLINTAIPKPRGNAYKWRKLKPVDSHITLIEDSLVKDIALYLPEEEEGASEKTASVGIQQDARFLNFNKAYDELRASILADFKRRMQKAKEERQQRQKFEDKIKEESITEPKK